MDFIEIVCCVLAGVLIGNYAADTATTKDCASKGEAKMMSEEKIKCEVIGSEK